MSILNKIDIHMNKILSLIKQIPKSDNKSCSSTFISTFNKNENSLYLKITKNNQLNNSSLQLQDNQNDLLTLENFPYSHLCNRDVDSILSLNIMYKHFLCRYVIYHYQKKIQMILIVFVHVIF